MSSVSFVILKTNVDWQVMYLVCTLAGNVTFLLENHMVIDLMLARLSSSWISQCLTYSIEYNTSISPNPCCYCPFYLPYMHDQRLTGRHLQPSFAHHAVWHKHAWLSWPFILRQGKPCLFFLHQDWRNMPRAGSFQVLWCALCYSKERGPTVVIVNSIRRWWVFWCSE